MGCLLTVDGTLDVDCILLAGKFYFCVRRVTDFALGPTRQNTGEKGLE